MFTHVLSNAAQVGFNVVEYAPAAAGDFDFKGLALVFALISLGLIGVVLAGSALFPEIAEQYKRQIPTVIVGLILVSVASTIIGSLGG